MSENTPNIDRYLDLLKHLSPASKLQLISRLKKTLHSELDADQGTSSFFREREFQHMRRSQEFTRNIDEL